MAMIMPMLMVSFLFSGSMGVAPEAIAGEKERGTMATLLVTPINRAHIAIGKILSLSVIALLSGLSSFLGVILVSGLVVILFTTGLSWLFQGKRYFDLELLRGEKKTCLTALYDTGNELKDPISGESVVVVGPAVAEYFFGLSKNQLSSPVHTLESNAAPGIRLIPYRTVDRSQGFLLAAPFDQVKINGKTSSRIVAFAPDVIGRKHVYDALIGGNVSCT